jgi:hypothetical protein
MLNDDDDFISQTMKGKKSDFPKEKVGNKASKTAHSTIMKQKSSSSSKDVL